jgi:hypothetical protein
MRKSLLIAVLVACTAVLAISSAQAQVPESMNYQGVLNDSDGNAVNGNVSLTLSIYAAPTGGTALWQETQDPVPVENGIFTVELGSAVPLPAALFDGSDRYLGTQVDGGTELVPRMHLATVPHAFRAASVPGLSPGPGNVITGQYGFAAGDSNKVLTDYGTVAGGEHNEVNVLYFADTLPDTNYGGPMLSSSLRAPAHAVFSAFVGGGFLNHAHGMLSSVVGGWRDSAAAPFSTIGGGFVNQTHAPARYSFTGGGYQNSMWNSYSVIGGGQFNVAGSGGANYISTVIGGGVGNFTGFHLATIGGGTKNVVTQLASTIGGGMGNNASGAWNTIGGGEQNFTQLDYTTVGGGRLNSATSPWATVAGGDSSVASGMASTVGGGSQNLASGQWSTASGGSGNNSSGQGATIGGGGRNVATGDYATIPGGVGNMAFGIQSHAAGSNAWAVDTCSFVWADCCVDASGTMSPFFSQGTNTFNARATGGFFLVTSCDLPGTGISSGVSVPAGGAAWVALSDSTMKRNIRPVDGADILLKLAQLPVKRWSYKSQDESVEHIGPMSQDFYRLFGLGEDDRHISTLDPDGIALAAIKELHARNNAQALEIERLKGLVDKQAKDVQQLRSALDEMNAALGSVLTRLDATSNPKLTAVTTTAATSKR